MKCVSSAIGYNILSLKQTKDANGVYGLTVKPYPNYYIDTDKPMTIWWKIVVIDVEDVKSYKQARNILGRCTFPSRIKNEDGTPFVQMNLDHAYTLEVHGKTVFQCIPSSIINMIEALVLINFTGVYWNEFVLAEDGAPVLCTVILYRTRSSKFDWKANKRLKIFKYKHKEGLLENSKHFPYLRSNQAVEGTDIEELAGNSSHSSDFRYNQDLDSVDNGKSLDCSVYFSDLTYNDGLEYGEMDQWSGGNTKALTSFFRPGIETKIVLFHVSGHRFEFLYQNDIYWVRVSVEKTVTFVDIIEPTLADFGQPIFLWVLIDESDTRNKISEILPEIYLLNDMVHKLILAHSDDEFIEELRTKLLDGKLPELISLSYTINLTPTGNSSKLDKLKELEHDLRHLEWPHGLKKICLIIRDADERVRTACDGKVVEIRGVNYPIYSVYIHGVRNNSKNVFRKLCDKIEECKGKNVH